MAFGALVACACLACGVSGARAAIVSEAVAQADYRGARVATPAARQTIPVSLGVASLELALAPVTARQLFPGFHEISYAVTARNSGTLTLGGLRVEENLNEDLASDGARARILAGPWLIARGLEGGSANPAFDGRTDLRMLAGDARLAPGRTAELGLRLHAVAPAGRLAFAPSVRAGAQQMPGTVEARAPAVPSEVGPRTPAKGLAASKRVVFGPVDESGGWARVTYRLGARAGDDVGGLSILDDLAGAFGRENYRIVSLDIVSAPEGFGATVNPFFDGADDTDLLTSGAALKRGEAIALDLTLRARARGESRANAVAVQGGSLGDGDARVSTAFPARADPPPVRLALSADRQSFGPGDRIAYEIAVSGAREPADIAVEMPVGLSYLAGSGSVGGARREPAADGGWLVWSDMPAGETRIAFAVVAGPAVSDGRHVVKGFARDVASGAIVSDVATVAAMRDEEAVYDCTGIFGTVFDDANQDGFRQADEAGIAGVKLVLGNGPSVLSARDGSYDLPCAVVGREAAGSAVELALAPATLPPGFQPTTPLSRRLALRRGQVAEADFGATSLPVFVFGLDAGSFEKGATRLTPAALAALARLIVRLERRPAILRIRYYGEAKGDLVARRLEAARALADAAWSAGARPHDLIIETQAEDGAAPQGAAGEE